VHTSTVTVAVLPEPTQVELRLDQHDLDWFFSRGTGGGGQHKNKTDTAVQLVHRPTGVMVRADSRSQASNKELALATLKARLLDQRRKKASAHRINMRKGQLGSGMRGDKVRTICVHKDLVHDHSTDKKMTYRKYRKGELEDLWPSIT
jgi:peptide chain release factor 1